MRRYLRTLLLLLLFAALFPFVFPWKDGKPLLSWSELRMPALSRGGLPALPALTLPQPEQGRTANQPVQLYRWRDGDGVMQFSNELPPAGVVYEVVEVNPDSNLIPALPPAKGATEEAATEGGDGPAVSIPSPLTVSPGEALQLLEDAKNLREQSKERLRQQEALTQ